MTGGQSDDDDGLSGDDDAQHTAEVWLPGDQSCLLPRLPAPGRQYHTQSSLTACGGWQGAETNCLTFDGEWEQSHSLSESRWQHGRPEEEKLPHIQW